MAKMPKAGTSRKPPEPSSDHEAIEEWMAGQMPALRPIVERLDALIREKHPDVHYALKWKKAYYGLPDVGWMLELVAYDVSVNIVFFGGAEFDDPPPLGSGDRGRYVKLKSVEEADTPEMAAWIEQAGKAPGWR